MAFLSKLVASKIKLFNSDHDKFLSSCFFDLSSLFLLRRSSISGCWECEEESPEKARKEPVNLGNSVGGISFKEEFSEQNQLNFADDYYYFAERQPC